MSRKLFKSTAIVALFTFLSRISGLVRDIVVSSYFGAKGGTDAFFVAFKIPNFFRRLFAEASFAYAFVPVLTEYRQKRTHEETQDLIDKVAGSLASVLFLITLIGVIAAPVVIMIFAPKWISQPDKIALAAGMLMLTFPYLFFICLTALAGGILNACGKFAVPAFTPVLLNLSIIASAIWISGVYEPDKDILSFWGGHYIEPGNQVMSLAWGVFIAGIVQLLFQIPFLSKIGLLPKLKWGFKDKGVMRIMKLMVPTLISSSVLQISLLIDLWLATSLTVGSVSWLYFSDRLVEFPLGVFGIALATVILPTLAKHYTDKSDDKFSGTMDWSLRWMFLISIPSAVGLFVLAGPLITTVYFRGKFDADDVLMTSWALMAYSVGLFGFILTKVLSPGFYARQDTRTPMVAAVKALVTKVVMSLALLYLFYLMQWRGAHIGLALATALAALLNAWFLYRPLRKHGIYHPGKGWTAEISRILLAVVVMAGLILFLSPALDGWLAMGLFERVTRVLLYVGLGMLAFLATVLITGMRPWRWKSGI